MLPLHVHLLEDPDPTPLAELHAALDPGISVTAGRELPASPMFDILVAGRPQAAHLNASPRLKAVIVPFAGVPEATQALLRSQPNLALHNLHHNAAATAEMAIGLMLAAAKRVVPADRDLRRSNWRLRYATTGDSVLLEGKGAVIAGFGAIGQRIARFCVALGMRTRAVRRHVTEPGAAMMTGGVEVFSIGALAQLLPEAHALIIALPLTDETRGVVGAAELAALPRGALLVNIGRGPIVDEAALFEALHSGHLGGAGLDVWYQYPPDEASRSHTPPSAFPFHELENVVMSPHRAGSYEEVESQRMAQLAQVLNAAARGDPLPNRVDVRAGY